MFDISFLYEAKDVKDAIKKLSENENSTEIAENELKIKYAYNDKRLINLKKKEIVKLRKKISETKENFKNKEKDREINELKKLMANSETIKNKK